MYKGWNDKKLFLKTSELDKEAKFNDRANFLLNGEAIKHEQGMLQVVLLRKADTYETVRETCFDYADNQKVFASQGEQIVDRTRSGH